MNKLVQSNKMKLPYGDWTFYFTHSVSCHSRLSKKTIPSIGMFAFQTRTFTQAIHNISFSAIRDDDLTNSESGRNGFRTIIILEEMGMILGQKSSDGLFVTSDGIFVASDNNFVTSDDSFVISDEIFVASDGSFVASDEIFTASDGHLMTSDKILVASDGHLVTSDKIFTSSDGHFVTSDKIFTSSTRYFAI